MKKILLFLCLAAPVLAAKAQVGTFSTINLPNIYTNQITSVVYSANYRSGLVFQTNGSINMGLVGRQASGFKFKWLARDTTAIDYSVDTSQIMALDFVGNLAVKNSITVGVPVAGDNPNPDINKYRLTVEGIIGARKIKVSQAKPWPDYVFKSDYQLPSLQYVEQFIKENEHLPEIPSAKEVKAEGHDLGEMNRLLLQKVEELTLYIIQLNKRVDEQQAIISKLSQQP